MPSFTVNVKWGKQKFESVEVNTDEAPEVFQAQMFALSSVPPERQKIMAKGKALKSHTWEGFPVKNGMMLLMMGSADALPEAPVAKTVFVEDMSDAQVAKATNLPTGLDNLGNTCYMNATVQCLKTVPELVDSLQKYSGQLTMSDSSTAITASMRDLYRAMDRSTADSLPPMMFLQVLHTAFPHFAEKTDHGVYQQQDANECWTQVIRMLQQKLPGKQSDGQSASSSGSLIDQYFGVDYKTSMKCDESENEPEAASSERVYQLSCFINQDVKYLHTGLRSRLAETITKASPSLGRDASYTKTSLIDRLPAYLTIQFVRFYYKEKENVNAKVLKDVKFPMTLDVFDFCSTDLKNKLQPMRDQFKDEDEKNVLKKVEAAKSGAKPMEVDVKKKSLPFSFPDDVGSNNSGYYELKAVLTHKGRSSSSGHYVGWVRLNGNEWVKCDDDDVTPVLEADVLKLSGGGDWHCAYVLLYGPKILKIDEE